MAFAVPRQKHQIDIAEFAAHELVRGFAEWRRHRHLPYPFETFHLVQPAAADHTDDWRIHGNLVCRDRRMGCE
jgi:hypothetical protein